MKLIQLSQKGFSLVETLLVIIAISVISLGGYYVYTQQNDKEDATNSNAVSTNKTAEKSSTQEYSGTAGAKTYTLQYPDGWTLKRGIASSAGGIEGMDRIIGPRGDVAVVPYFYTGEIAGRGGDCDPSEQPTITYVEKHKLPNVPELYLATAQSSGNYFRSVVVNADKEGTIKQGASVCEWGITDNFYTDDNGSASLTIMSLSTLASAEAPTEEWLASFLDSADFDAAVQIVRTLNAE